MKLSRLLLSSLVLATFVSVCACSKKEDDIPGGNTQKPEPGEIVQMQFEATFSETFDTKADLNNLRPVWQEGDRISIIGSEGVVRDLSLKSIDGSTAVFEGDAESDGPYYAVFPYSENAVLEDSYPGTIEGNGHKISHFHNK